jgi:hypothetical protein
MIGNLGLPELVVILALLLLLTVSIFVVVFLIRRFASPRSQSPMLASKLCRNCGQRIPDVGTFCLFCGQRQV